MTLRNRSHRVWPAASLLLWAYAAAPALAATDIPIDVAPIAPEALAGAISSSSVTGGAYSEKILDERVTLASGVPPTQQTLRLRNYPVEQGTEIVRAGARTLTPGVDYTLNPQTGELRLLRSDVVTAQDTALLVSYTTQPTTVVANVPSSASNTLSFNAGKLSANATISGAQQPLPLSFAPDDPSRISAVPGGDVNWNALYTPSDHLTVSANGTNARQLVSTWANGAARNQTVQQQGQSFSIDLHAPKYPSLQLQHSSNQSYPQGASGIGDSSTTDSLASAWSNGKVSASVNLGRSTTQSEQLLNYSAGMVGGTNKSASTSDNAALSLGFTPNDKLNMGVSLTANHGTTDSNGQVSTSGGQGVSANASLKASKHLSYTASMQTYTTDPVNDGTGGTSPGQQTQNVMAGATWQPSDRLTVGVSHTIDRATTGPTTMPLVAADGTTRQPNPNYSNQSITNTTTLSTNYRASGKLDLGMNLSASNAKADGDSSKSSSRGSSMQATANYRPAKNLSVNASALVGQTQATDALAGGATMPGQRNRNLTVGTSWQAAKNLQVQANYTADRYSYGDGKNATTNASASIAYQPSARTQINAYAGRLAMQNPTNGAAANKLVGMSAQVATGKHTTVGVDVQHQWGEGGDSASQLWQSSALPRASAASGSDLNAYAAPGQQLTSVGANVGYHLDGKQDLVATAQALSGSDGANGAALGLSWQYHASDKLTFSLSGRHVKYGGANSPFANGTNEISVEGSLRL